MAITYHSEDIDFKIEDEAKTSQWLMAISEEQESCIIGLTYIFCSDEYLLQINKQYLNHDYYTDIITFPYKQGKEVESDIFISIDRIKDHANAYKTTFEDELYRVIAHGLLHLIGFNDKTDKDQKIMTEMEDQCLQNWKKYN